MTHQFDRSTFEGHRAGEGGIIDAMPWLPCRENTWCAKYADRFSTSIVSRGAPHLFHSENGGMIVALKLEQASPSRRIGECFPAQPSIEDHDSAAAVPFCDGGGTVS